MSEVGLLAPQIAVLTLLLLACLAALTFESLRFPYSVGLVILGFGLGGIADQLPLVSVLGEIDLSPELILFLFLPPLIFESSLSLDFRLLARNLVPILGLAVPGLLLSAVIIGGVMGGMTSLTWAEGVLFGTVISATDPVAVIALLKEVGVPQRLTVLIEGESLFNDATAIVVFSLLREASRSGDLGWGAVGQGIGQGIGVLGGGILIGMGMALIIGYLLLWARHQPLIQGTLSGILAYGTFILAEHGLHVSGVIAVMTAGLVVGWIQRSRLTPQTRAFLREFWEYISFIANSLIFLLIGLNTVELLQDRPLAWGTVLSTLGIAIVAALGARAVTIFTLFAGINRLHWAEPVEARHQLISFWGGLRGAVALALALSLEPEFPHRDLILMLTLGVTLFTILGNGLTLRPLLHWVELDTPPLFLRLFQARALVEARHQGLQKVQELHDLSRFPTDVIDHLRQQQQTATDQAEQTLFNLWSTISPNPMILRRAIWIEALNVERKQYQQLYDQGVIIEETLDRLYLMLTLKEDQITMDQLPIPQQVNLPNETQLEGVMTRIADRVFLPIEKYLGHRREDSDPPSDRSIDPALRTRCEYLYGIAYVSRHVAEEIQQFAADLEVGQEDPAHSEVIDHCVQSYQALEQQALTRIDQHQDLAELEPLFQERLARQSVLSQEQEVINHLLAEGSIQERIASSLRAQLQFPDRLSG